MSRRHVITSVTMLVLCLILLLFLIVGGKALFAPLPGSEETATTTPGCVTKIIKAGKAIRARQVRVNVYNAGSRNGLADQTMTTLQARGFRNGATGNAPASSKVERVQVWTTEKDDPSALLVARQFGPGLKVMVTDQELGAGIDVLVGDDYPGLAPNAATTVKLAKPRKVCVPTGND